MLFKFTFSALLFLILFSLPTKADAQLVKFIKNPVTAKYRVFITRRAREATHRIYRVAGPTDIRKPGEWYIVPNPQLFKNAMTLFEVKDKNEADLIVYYVSTRDSAAILMRRE